MTKNTVFGAFSQTARLGPRAQRQILDVYLTLASTTASSVAGYYTADRLRFAQAYMFALSIGIFALALGIYLTPATRQNLPRRRVMLWSTGWLTGAVIQPTITPLMHHGYAHIVYMALGTCIALFASFSVSVMSSTRAQVVNAMGASMFAISALSWVTLLDWFFPSRILSNISLMTALAVPCLSAVAHTSGLIDRAARNEDIDPIIHALGFFNDLVRMFIHLLELFSNEKRRREEEERDGEDGEQNASNRAGKKSSGQRRFYSASNSQQW